LNARTQGKAPSTLGQSRKKCAQIGEKLPLPDSLGVLKQIRWTTQAEHIPKGPERDNVQKDWRLGNRLNPHQGEAFPKGNGRGKNTLQGIGGEKRRKKGLFKVVYSEL